MKLAQILVTVSLIIALSFNVNGQILLLKSQSKTNEQIAVEPSIEHKGAQMSWMKSLFSIEYHSYESCNYPGYFIRHANGLGELSDFSKEITFLDANDSAFALVPGLANANFISFQSKNYPTYYLRHQGGRIKLNDSTVENSQLFKEDATYKLKPGLADSSAVSFESYNYPGNFLRHDQEGHLLIEANDNSQQFKEDATFKEEGPRVAVKIKPEDEWSYDRHPVSGPSVLMIWELHKKCCSGDWECENTYYAPSFPTWMAFMDDGTWGTIPYKKMEDKPSKIVGSWKHDGNQFWWTDEHGDHYLNWAEDKMEGQGLNNADCYEMKRVS